MEISNRNIILTGGVKGIGKKIVERLIDEKASVGVLDIDKEGLQNLKEDYPDIYCDYCNVSNFKDTVKSVNKFYKKFNKIDILINNAGVLYNSPLVTFSRSGLKSHNISDWGKIIDLNLNSVFYMTVNVVEKMIQDRTKGLVINMSSISASGNIGQSAYSAAKAGVNALTSTWAKELGVMGIRVVSIAPGYTDTESTKDVMNKTNLEQIINEVPIKRLGKPQEIADSVIFVIKNDFLNAKILEIDGGLILN